MQPSRAARKNYIEEVTRLMKLWINDIPLTEIALKAVHVMPALLLQKSSKSSKSKDRHALSYGRKGRLRSCSMKDELYRKG